MTKRPIVLASCVLTLFLVLSACSRDNPSSQTNVTPLVSSWHIQTLDSAGRVGEYSSLALDSSSNPVISYFAADAGDLKLVHCGNSDCSIGNSDQLVDVPGLVGVQSSLVLDSNGNPVISYFDGGNGDLKLVKCGNSDCSSGNSIQTVDTGGARIRVAGLYSSLVLDSLGNPVISYQDANNDLKLVHCGSADCSTDNRFQVVDSTGDVGLHTSLALDSNGNPVISYFDFTNFDLKLVKCGNVDCSLGNSVQVVDSIGSVGRYTSLELDGSGNPVISYWDFTNLDLKLVHCGNADCSSLNTITTVDSTGDVGSFTSLELNSAGNPVISYFDGTNYNIRLAQCGNSNCSDSNVFTNVDNTGIPLRGEHISLALDNVGNPVISYYDALNGDLKLARLVNTADDATPPVITAHIGGALGNNDWYTSNVNVSWTVTDNESAILSSTGCDAAIITTDSAATIFTCEATSGGGVASQSVTIKRDATPPTLNPVVSPSPVLLLASASVVSHAGDVLAGLGSESCGAVDTSSVGSKSVSCNATDLAGNTNSTTANYQVIYNFSGFFSPVDNLPVLNEVNADRAIPVRFSLAGNHGLNILSATSQTIACDPNAPIDRIEQTVNATTSRLTYSASTKRYTYIWKTSKSWEKTCRQLVITLNDGTQHRANFKLK